MGSRGPAPKREQNRAGHNAKSEKPDTVVCGGDVLVPEPDPAWHPRALSTYLDFAQSGQTKYWEPSDWRMLVLACDNLTVHYGSTRPSAEMFKHTVDILKALGATEADRRRMRIEIERPGADDASDATPDTKDSLAARFQKLAGDA